MTNGQSRAHTRLSSGACEVFVSRPEQSIIGHSTTTKSLFESRSELGNVLTVPRRYSKIAQHCWSRMHIRDCLFMAKNDEFPNQRFTAPLKPRLLLTLYFIINSLTMVWLAHPTYNLAHVSLMVISDGNQRHLFKATELLHRLDSRSFLFLKICTIIWGFFVVVDLFTGSAFSSDVIR